MLSEYPQPGFYRSGKRLRGYRECDVLRTITLVHQALRIRVDTPSQYLRDTVGDLRDWVVDNRDCDGADEAARLCNLSTLSEARADQWAVIYDWYMNHVYSQQVSSLAGPTSVKIAPAAAPLISALEELLEEEDLGEVAGGRKPEIVRRVVVMSSERAAAGGVGSS